MVECQLGTFGKIDFRERICRTFGICQSVLNGYAHIRFPKLRHNGTIFIFHCGMNDALGMHQHFDLICIYAKEPFCFHDFQTFIHQCGRVDGDLFAHAPVRMTKGICRCYIFQFVQCFSTERPAGSCQQDTTDLIVFIALQRLENSRMFTVYGINGNAFFLCQIHYQLTCGNQRFLICQCDVFSCGNGFESRTQTHIAHNRCDNSICFRKRCRFHQTIHASYHFTVGVCQTAFQFFGVILVHNRNQSGTEFSRLFFQQLNIVIAADGTYLNIPQHFHNFQCLCADGAGRAQNRDCSHIFHLYIILVHQSKTTLYSIRQELSK